MRAELACALVPGLRLRAELACASVPGLRSRAELLVTMIVEYISTKLQLADIMTQGLPGEKFVEGREQFGMLGKLK